MLEQWSASLGQQHSFSWEKRVFTLLGPGPKMMPVSINQAHWMIDQIIVAQFEREKDERNNGDSDYFVRPEGEETGLSAHHRSKKSRFLIVHHAWIDWAI